MSQAIAVVANSRPKVRPLYAFSFALVHVAALGAFAVGFSWKGVVLCIASYYLRMFGLTAGFHRYFSHRTFQLNRFWQFMLAFLAMTSAQKGVLWWAAHHRHHHRYSDQPEDLHSPVQGGFWWSHMGWILTEEYSQTRFENIQDFAKFKELVWLDRNQYVPTMLYAIAMTAAFGWTGLFWGYFLSTVILWHGTFTINSVMHVFGKRVYRTSDDSRNSMIFALLTMGEGWHNNHHYYPGSAAQAFHWWQVDVSYYLLLLGEKIGIVKKMRRVPERVKLATEEVLADTRSPLDMRIHALQMQWARAKASALLFRASAVAELEIARDRAAARLRQLEADYALMRAKAGAAAEKKLEQCSRDIDATKQQLIETLERLLATAQPVAV